MRVLVTGWSSFLHGEATAGDVLSLRGVGAALASAGVAFDIAWSPVFQPAALHLADADPGRYSHLVFACGPAHGEQVRELHECYANCRRIAVGVSVLDPDDAAVTGFHRVLARDDRHTAKVDLAVATPADAVPVVGVIFAPGQAEYGEAGRHGPVHETLRRWLREQDCGRVPLDTRLATDDWALCATADQFTSVLSRFDAVVSTRLHGLALGLRAGIPVLAVDPVAGGGKVTAQAEALGWPAVVSAEDVDAPGVLEARWRWCLSAEGKAHAARRDFIAADALLDELLGELLDGNPV
jgi:hypothetical protein